MDDKVEVFITIPDGYKLVGTRTDGNTVIAVFEKIKSNNNKIGYV